MVDWSVYLVTEQRASAGRSTPDVVASALDGGVGVVQLRDKALPVRDRLAIGREVRELTRDAGVPLIVNDRVDLAQAIDADGVHLGDDDLPVEVAREMLGEDAIIGRSASFVEDAIAAEGTGADYLGVGSVYATDSKDDVPEDGSTPSDPSACVPSRTPSRFPSSASAGSPPRTPARVAAAGADGVAIISAITTADDPRAAAKGCETPSKAVETGSKLPRLRPIRRRFYPIRPTHYSARIDRVLLPFLVLDRTSVGPAEPSSTPSLPRFPTV